MADDKTDDAEQPAQLVKIDDRAPMQLARVDRSSVALAEQAKAEIAARVQMARMFPRSLPAVLDRVRATMMLPSVAERCIYSVPRGKERAEGLSIRAAEELRGSMGNIGTKDMIVADDEDSRTVTVIATDYESMTFEERSFVVPKRVERKFPKDREVLSVRSNTAGEKVHLCRATDDELAEKQAALASKARRGVILAIIPVSVRDAAMAWARASMHNTALKNRAAGIAQLKASYAKLSPRVTQEDLASYLGHAVDDATGDELTALEMMFTAITEKHDTWKNIMRAKAEADAADAPAADDAAPQPVKRERAGQAQRAVDAATKPKEG